jgi:hypothetical protein
LKTIFDCEGLGFGGKSLSFQKLEKSSPDLDLGTSQIYYDPEFLKKNMKKCLHLVMADHHSLNIRKPKKMPACIL